MKSLWTVDRWLLAWKQQNWRKMLKDCQKSWVFKRARKDSLLWLQNRFSPFVLLSWEHINVDDQNGVLKDFTTRIRYERAGRKEDVKINIRLVCEAAPYDPKTLDEGGTWGVNPVSVKESEQKDVMANT